ncbi:MAG: hypothetical protein DCF30_11375, partial [Hyphomicrobiales bacterium]
MHDHGDATLRKWLIGSGLVALAVAGGYWTLRPTGGTANEAAYRSAPVDRGQITAAVRATGTLGRLKAGQPTTFTVNAYPNRTFEGRVEMVRLGAQTIQNVVTYTGVIRVANADMALLPGMTANLQVVTEDRQDVLRVANAALRFRPAGMATAPAALPRATPGQGPERGQGGGRGGAPLRRGPPWPRGCRHGV